MFDRYSPPLAIGCWGMLVGICCCLLVCERELRFGELQMETEDGSIWVTPGDYPDL